MPPHLLLIPSTIIAFTGLLAMSTPANTADDRDRVAVPQTSTIAGSGLRGIADGNASDAEFLAPTGVAISADGTIYVADVAAQNIRRIRGRVVDTFAGTSDAEDSPESRSGGFANGPAHAARFDRPIAIATRGNDVYVADAGNHCIRRIANDNVTTIARNFNNLKGVAVATDGQIYIADDGIGIRRIARDGILTTLALPSDRKSALGVAVRTIAGRDYLAYTDATHVYLGAIGAPKPQSLAFDDEREPDGSGVAVGHAYAIAILNQNTVVVSDTTTHAVRLIRFPAPPFVTGRAVRGIAGGVSEGSDIAGGFADGPPWRAKLDTPTALALAADGGVVIADAGNRRIRKIAGLDARESVLPDLSNFATADRGYHITIVGNSYAFYNVLWPESIGGRIEAGLARDAASIELPARPSVNTFRIDAASAEATLGIIHEYLLDSRTNLIVLLLNAYVDMKSDALDRLRNQLDRAHIKLLVVYTPQGFEISPRDFFGGKRDGGETNVAKLRAEAAKNESYYHMTRVRGLYLLDPMETQTATQNRQPLFYSSEHHLTIYGSEWVGRRITDELERWKPWKKDSVAAAGS